MAGGRFHKIFPLGLLFILPLLGIYLLGHPLSPFINLPLLLTQPGEISFVSVTFVLLTFLIALTLFPFVFRVVSYRSPLVASHPGNRPFPWWGWVALLCVLCGWLLAWTRFPWLADLQLHTFSMLWFGYIFLINASTFSRTGNCLFENQRTIFLSLFPLSAAFWWIFEYLNQFVHNWHYVNLPNLSPFAFFLLTSLSFSTVLPAVLSTTEWLRSFHGLTAPFTHWRPVPACNSLVAGWILLTTGSLWLLMVGVWPAFLFPALWLSPLFLFLGYSVIRREPTVLNDLALGNWLSVVLPALAGLCCGFWWELWNSGSHVHWEYSIPLVHGFQLFEMPILGYAGYLPFGLECLVITEWFLGRRPWEPLQQTCSRPNPGSSEQDHAPRGPISLGHLL
ncbi:MAG: hypothetical protein AB7T38_08705 [Nitrospirales bacterium]